MGKAEKATPSTKNKTGVPRPPGDDILWKQYPMDEEEFAEHLAYPHGYWVSDEAAVRAEGERVVKLIDAGEFPFDGSGTGFRPDPAWSGPVMWTCPSRTVSV